jgi:hypothetical protein
MCQCADQTRVAVNATVPVKLLVNEHDLGSEGR